MNSYLKPLLAIAAIVVVAVAGFAILRPSSPGSVGRPDRLTIAGCLGFAIRGPINERRVPVVVHGTRRRSRDPARRQPDDPAVPAGSTFTVPEGWVNDGDYGPVYTLLRTRPPTKPSTPSPSRLPRTSS